MKKHEELGLEEFIESLMQTLGKEPCVLGIGIMPRDVEEELDIQEEPHNTESGDKDEDGHWGSICVSSPERILEDIIHQCVEEDIQIAKVVVSYRILADIVYYNAKNLTKYEEGFKLSTKDVDITLFGSDVSEDHVISICNEGVLKGGEDIETLVEYLVNHPNEYKKVQMNIDTYTAIMREIVISGYDDWFNGKVVIANNSMPFGTVEFLR